MRGFQRKLRHQQQVQAQHDEREHDRALEVDKKLRALEEAHLAAHGHSIIVRYSHGWVYIGDENAKRFGLRLRVLQLDEVTRQLWAAAHEKELDAPPDPS